MAPLQKAPPGERRSDWLEQLLDLGVMGAFTLVAAVLFRSERRVGRYEGALLVTGYLAFLGTLVLTR